MANIVENLGLSLSSRGETQIIGRDIEILYIEIPYDARLSQSPRPFFPAASENAVTQLTHVRSRQEIKAAEEIAQRNPLPKLRSIQTHL
jgi:hypothetical protein